MKKAKDMVNAWFKSIHYDKDNELKAHIVFEYDNSYSYSWDVYKIWIDEETNRLFWYQGSGCSCNSESEEYNDLFDLEDQEITKSNFETWYSELRGEDLPHDERHKAREVVRKVLFA